SDAPPPGRAPDRILLARCYCSVPVASRGSRSADEAPVSGDLIVLSLATKEGIEIRLRPHAVPDASALAGRFDEAAVPGVPERPRRLVAAMARGHHCRHVLGPNGWGHRVVLGGGLSDGCTARPLHDGYEPLASALKEY